MPEPSRELVERRASNGSVRSAGPPRSPGDPVVPPGGYLRVMANATSRISLELLAARGPLAHALHMRLVCQRRYISASTFERMHRELVQGGLVVCLPHDRDRRLRVDDLTPHARSLLRIAREVEAVERWASRGVHDPCAPSLLCVIADRRRWLVLRELFDGPLRYTELSARLPWLPQGTFNELLGTLTRGGLVRVQPVGARRDQHHYALSQVVPALARVILLSSRFRRQITPSEAPWLTGELPSFIRLLERAPALRGPCQARGIVLLQVVKPPEEERGWPEIEVAMRHGRIVAHRLGTAAPHAIMRAPPLAWCDALLDADLSGAEIEGDMELARTLLAATAAVVATCPRA